jgi:YfiH family protein
VVTVTKPGEHAGAEADAAVTTAPGCVLAVRTADCVPIVLHGSDHRAVGVVHAGWRGLAEGVVDAAIAAMRAVDVEPTAATVGPHIRAGCYEFGSAELAEVATALGAEVVATTLWGTPALDLTAGVHGALRRSGVTDVVDGGGCTACTDQWFSHRARRDAGRFATTAWLEG